MQIIDFENHFFTASYLGYLRRRQQPPRETIDDEGPNMWYDDTMCSPRSFEIDDRMADLGESRIKAMDEGGIDWIPNGPEDLHGSSMARGTSPGLWPCRVLDPTDELVRRSFTRYWDKWIAPHGGGYMHQNNFWPYGGMEVAHCYLFLDDDEKESVTRAAGDLLVRLGYGLE